ncbi:MAG: hypothetical protein ACLFPB_09030, partial [Desulfovermiculus sp.]
EIYREKAFFPRDQRSEIRSQEETEGQREEGTEGQRELSERSDGSDMATEATGGLREGGWLPVARELGETSLMFLVHPTLRGEEIEKTCAVVAEVMYEATSANEATGRGSDLSE